MTHPSDAASVSRPRRTWSFGRRFIRLVPPSRINRWLRIIERIPLARRWLTIHVVRAFAEAAPPRPRPYSLAVDGYTSWITLSDRTYTSRHLPVCSEAYVDSLPEIDKVVDLILAKTNARTRPAPDTSLLFPFFAQWFTDGFLRTDPSNFRKNQSNHGIDVCQIYGQTIEQTNMLRTRQGGRLKSQHIDDQEYPAFLFEKNDQGQFVIRGEFEGLYSKENFDRVFVNRPVADEHRERVFAVGLEHGNSTLGNTLMNVIFLREHNRVADLLAEEYSWDDERLFQTARNIVIVMVLKIVIQDYIRHIAGYDLPLDTLPGAFERETWYRTNWMAVEFNLLYRWHSLIPAHFSLDDTEYDAAKMVNANRLLLDYGPDEVTRSASTQSAGRIGLKHTPSFLRDVITKTVQLARDAKLRPYNDYRKYFDLEPLENLQQLTRDSEILDELTSLYCNVDRVEFLVGLLAEDYVETEIMGHLQLVMVAHDAFTHALTNPLIASAVFNETTFSAEGLRQISATNRLRDIVMRNTGIDDPAEVSFEYRHEPRHRPMQRGGLRQRGADRGPSWLTVPRIAAMVGVTALLGLILWTYRRYVADAPPHHFTNAIDHFKYGSDGSEQSGLPYPIWKALPEVCSDLLPGGWTTLGLYMDPGQDMPIGTSVRKYGLARVGLNCAACHAGQIEVEGLAPQLVLGMPNSRFDGQAYNNFIISCVLSDRFTAANVFASVTKVGLDMPFYDRWVYRLVVFEQIRKRARDAKAAFAWMESRPPQGPGRADTANLFRMVLDQHPEGDDIAGPVDFPSLWNQGLRVSGGGGQHWDGNNDSFRERSYTSALASGATEQSIDIAAIDRVAEWITDLPPPAFPVAIDAAKAELGRAIWIREQCHDCHDFGAAKAGQVVPLAAIATDPGRFMAFTPATAEAFKRVGVGKPWHITHYRKTNGYLSVWTDGIWSRGPYLHNGSVPTLYDLLLPVEQRPREFLRGCSVLDPVKVGWSCTTGFAYRTDQLGNSNAGHTYGTQLSDEERWQLVEYMKTL